MARHLTETAGAGDIADSSIDDGGSSVRTLVAFTART
jgi:hypothetical protein